VTDAHSMNPLAAADRGNPWFEERRNLFVRQAIMGLYQCYHAFQEITRLFRDQGELPFENLAALVGTESAKGLLWQLKDDCHRLWRNHAHEEGELHGCLLDWIIGSIFHEMMKLKENCYMVQFYGPLAEKMKEAHPGTTIEFCGEACEQFMERTRQEINQQVQTLAKMLDRALSLARSFLADQRDNPLLLRFLIEHSEVSQVLWGMDLDQIMAEIYPEGAEHGYCAAGRSYLTGDWYQEALAAFEKALAINPGCEEARRQVLTLSAMVPTSAGSAETVRHLAG